MINDLLRSMIDEVLAERRDRHGWDDGLFHRIFMLSADQRGEIGERLLEQALKAGGVGGVTRAGELDRTQKHWDIRTDDMDIEVKTATLGRNANSFQHESIERDRQYHALVFIDIAPNEIYISWIAKSEINWGALHRRATGIYYKWDTRLPELKAHNLAVGTIADVMRGYSRIVGVLGNK